MALRNAEAFGMYLTDPGAKLAAMTPTDVTTGDATAPITIGVWVGGAGNLAVVMAGNDTATPVTLTAVPAGTFLPLRAVRIASTGTTATLIVGVYNR